MICTAGQYCETSFLTSPSGDCTAGFFCDEGSKYIDGNNVADEDYGNPCGNGVYCEQGTDQVQSCPVGTFNEAAGLKGAEDCQLCTEGYYCETEGKKLLLFLRRSKK